MRPASLITILARIVLLWLAVLIFAGCKNAPEPPHFFAIEIVDAQSERGVPLVELRTVNDIRYYSDSNGLIAFHEPGLMDREVYFQINGPGYEYPADGFGNRGLQLRTTPGKTARVKIHRLNIAERLYRITGQGIYSDTILLGRKAPIHNPVLNGRVLGQDSVMALPYRGKIYWFWGDTQRESYPLGHFATAGATSAMPADGGLDPSVGINLTYFVEGDGFSRKLVPLPGEGAVWIDALMTLNDPSGKERLVAHYSRMKSLTKRLEHGLVMFNDHTQTFERLVQFELDAPLGPGGQALKVLRKNGDYIYFAQPYPFLRVRANWLDVTNQQAYEGFTCLGTGSRSQSDPPQVERNPDRKLVWSWKLGTAGINLARQRELTSNGLIKAEEVWINLRDAEDNKPIQAHAASVRWNDFRRRYVMICQGIGSAAPSYTGDIWYVEAELPEGPWLWAHKIVSHRDYTFYNPCQHSFFDQQGGRIIYFEGTYTAEFSVAKDKTPRYNYNQIMYRLDLADPRLERRF